MLIYPQVTGDYALTAQAIAKECGILSSPADLVHDFHSLEREKANEVNKAGVDSMVAPDEANIPSSIVLSGPELITLNDNQWDQLCRYDEIVFARTTPEQKLRIVKGKSHVTQTLNGQAF